MPVDGEVYVYDCVEFNPDLRYIDVASDLSFLIMDLERLGADDVASRLLAEYRRLGGDLGGDPLVSFFASFRAWVRAKVACLTTRDASQGDSEGARSESEARKLLRLGHRFAWSARVPSVLSICGVAGSGKTTLADQLSAASGWPHVSSDLTRKQLAEHAVNGARTPRKLLERIHGAHLPRDGKVCPPGARAGRRGDRRRNLPSPRRAGRVSGGAR